MFRVKNVGNVVSAFVVIDCVENFLRVSFHLRLKKLMIDLLKGLFRCMKDS